MENKEFEFNGLRMNGFVMMCIVILFFAASVLLLTVEYLIGLGFALMFLGFLLLPGFTLLQPNEARAMVFFGKYKGTFRNTGFCWVNPFMTKMKVSLRARNLNASPIKVNDQAGNPVMIGLVLVWRISDVYKAMFEIDSQNMASSGAPSGKHASSGQALAARMRAFENFVEVQSDAALRQVAGQYAYDGTAEDGDLTLRSGGEEINLQLESRLNERLSLAGIEAVEARINYLAYAPEIAAVMLRRQQADAIISAREKIVEGAVTMVKMALDKLAAEDVVELDDEKKAAMVSNLLVVLCADEPASPVLNTGTIYQ